MPDNVVITGESASSSSVNQWTDKATCDKAIGKPALRRKNKKICMKSQSKTKIG